MQIPKLRQNAKKVQTISVFGGYDHNLRIPDGAFYEMSNMTSDHYPVLASRKKRTVKYRGEDITGIGCSHGLCWVRGGDLYLLDGQLLELGLSSQEKTLIPMGGYLIILPDKKWVNVAALETDDWEDAWGDMENVWENGSSRVEVRFCDPDGSPREEGAVARQKPAEPLDGQLWQDDSLYPPVLKRWNGETGTWLVEENSCVELSATGIGKGFYPEDSVQISLEDPEVQLSPVSRLLKVEEDRLVLRGYLYSASYSITGENALQISRRMPDMDMVIACGNRLWGCKYGITEKGFVNELYCSKLGDFRNWQSFEGISTDSYVASVGVDGQFTGAIAYMGRPVFFKENSMIEVFGSHPANYQIQTTVCPGVEKTCRKSLAVVNNVLYYKSRHGVCAFDGSMPVQKGTVFGPVHYTYAVACAWGNKYCMAVSDHGKWSLFLYDTLRDLWHREDIPGVLQLAAWENSVYCLTGDRTRLMDLAGEDGYSDPEEENRAWMLETGPMGLIEPEKRYVSKLSLRLWLDSKATANISCCYDNDNRWIPLVSLQGTELGNVTVPIRPRRCDFLRLRLEGEGAVQIYAITKTWEEGSDVK